MTQLRDASDLNPFDHEDVAVAIETSSVRADKFARDKLFARAQTQLAVVAGLVLAQVGDHVVVLVHQGDARIQLRDQQHALTLVKMARIDHAADKAVML